MLMKRSGHTSVRSLTKPARTVRWLVPLRTLAPKTVHDRVSPDLPTWEADAETVQLVAAAVQAAFQFAARSQPPGRNRRVPPADSERLF
jgi:hypothetical protein